MSMQVKIDQHLLHAFDLVIALDQTDHAAEAFLEARGKQRSCERAQQRLQHHMRLVWQQAPVLTWAAENFMQKFFTAARQVQMDALQPLTSGRSMCWGKGLS